VKCRGGGEKPLGTPSMNPTGSVPGGSHDYSHRHRSPEGRTAH
jgi:hypothetical protein